MLTHAEQLPLPLEFVSHQQQHRAWSYLISDSLVFQKGVHHGIRIQKPEQEKVPAWIVRLISSGQCNTIYVENLTLPNAERTNILQLCDMHSVSLINLKVTPASQTTCEANVVCGPW